MSKQHYLPQFYLKGFCDPSTPKPYKPYVWQLTKESKGWRRKAPCNICCEPDFYSFTNEKGESDNSVDKDHKKIESAFAPILSRIKSRDRLPKASKILISQFIASLSLRIPIWLIDIC